MVTFSLHISKTVRQPAQILESDLSDVTKGTITSSQLSPFWRTHPTDTTEHRFQYLGKKIKDVNTAVILNPTSVVGVTHGLYVHSLSLKTNEQVSSSHQQVQKQVLPQRRQVRNFLSIPMNKNRLQSGKAVVRCIVLWLCVLRPTERLRRGLPES